MWVNNSGSLPTPSGGYVSFGLPGSPDIIGFGSNGQFIGFEAKTGGAESAKVQRQFARIAWAMGARVYVIRSVDDALYHLETLELEPIDMRTMLP